MYDGFIHAAQEVFGKRVKIVIDRLRCTPSSRPKLASHKLSYAPGISPLSDTLPLASDS
jgi:hypothetical protein